MKMLINSVTIYCKFRKLPFYFTTWWSQLQNTVALEKNMALAHNKIKTFFIYFKSYRFDNQYNYSTFYVIKKLSVVIIN